MELFERIRKISANVEQQIDILRKDDEEAVKQVSISPFIEALGYDTSYLPEVKSQFIIGTEWVDYAIKCDGQPIILVEAKRARDTLSEKRWKQLHKYFGATEVRFAILTNGIEYQFFTDLKKLNTMDRVPFLTLDMRNLRNNVIGELQAFTKSGYDPERALSSAKRSALYRAVRNEFEHPSYSFVAFFVQSVTYALPTAADVSLLKESLDDFIKDTIASSEPFAVDTEPSHMDDIVSESVSPIPTPGVRKIVEIPVHADYEGQSFTATLLFDPFSRLDSTYLMSKTKIRIDGEEMGVNHAEMRARKSINPNAKQTWLGWKRWKLREPKSGEFRAIKELLRDTSLRVQFLQDA